MYTIYMFLQALGGITIFLAASIYLLLSLWIGCLAYNKTKLISSIPGWAAWSMMVTPVIALVSMLMCYDANDGLTKQGEAQTKKKLEPAI